MAAVVDDPALDSSFTTNFLETVKTQQADHILTPAHMAVELISGQIL